jgi:phosphoribosylglycinamide formyltransferase-1
MGKTRVGILISGRGSNMDALIAACAAPDFPAEIVCVLSNRPEAAGLARAAKAGIHASAFDHRSYGAREDFERDLDRALKDLDVELVCSAGFMRLLSPFFVEAWRDRQLNIHPSLLPAFRGLDTHARAIAAGARFSGATVHFVRQDMDEGPIVAQAVVPVAPDDTPETLGARVLAAEHILYPNALRLVTSRLARVEGERVAIPAGPLPKSIIHPLISSG